MATTPQPSPVMIHTSQHHITTTEHSVAKRWGRGGDMLGGVLETILVDIVHAYIQTQCEVWVSFCERGGW